MRISDWSSDVCSSDLLADEAGRQRNAGQRQQHRGQDRREIRTAPEQAAIIVDRIGIAFSHRTGTERDDAERADRGDDVGQQVSRSDERSTGKEGVSPYRYRRSAEP